MAVAFQTIQTGSFQGRSSGENTTVTHPSGLTAGDLMIVHLTQCSNITGATMGFNTPTDWTSLGSDTADSGGSTVKMSVFRKVATAGDVSAGSTVFARSGSNDAWTNYSAYRIDGQGDASGIQIAFDDVVGDSTPVYTNTVTPSFADSLVLFLVSAEEGAASGSITDASYAITNNNPTWTERADSYASSDAFFGAGDGDGLHGGATASRPETSATGDSSCTLINFTNSVGAIVVIPPATSVNVSPAVITMTASVQAPTVTGGAVVSPAVITMTASVQAPTVTLSASDWVNTDKSSAGSITNTPKS